MELGQKLELRKLLIPELRQSLKVLALGYLEIKDLIEHEIEINPCLEDARSEERVRLSEYSSLPFAGQPAGEPSAAEYARSLITQRLSLHDVLFRQLGMFAATDEEFRAGREIIGNIDDNGYLSVSVDEIAGTLAMPAAKVRKCLALIQKFEPPGAGARGISECLLIQLDARNETDARLRRIVADHLPDLAKKNYSRIAKSLNESLDEVMPLIRKILRLDPKPGRNFSREEAVRIIEDAVITERDDEFQISINREDIPMLNVNAAYTRLLKDRKLDAQTKAYLRERLTRAREILRALSKRTYTLRKIIETIVEFQPEAVRHDLSRLTPMTFDDIAGKTGMHPSTVCRAVMNKYVRVPYGVVALKDFFSSHVYASDGRSVSSTRIKRLIAELIQAEDKRKPLSDFAIARILADRHRLSVSRRTVAKYREALKILAAFYRRER